MNLICENYTYQLGDACEYQVGVKCILVLGFTSGQTEAVFYVIDRPLHICPGFVGLVPFVSPPHNAWIGTEIFLRISVNHPAAGRCGTWGIYRPGGIFRKQDSFPKQLWDRRICIV